ncbi:MAG: MMPL family transporter [Acidimicrobiales bacterium]
MRRRRELRAGPRRPASPEPGPRSRSRLSRGAKTVAALGVLWLIFGLAGGSFQGKLASVQKNSNTAFLPASAPSTKVNDLAQKFQSVQAVPGFVVYQRQGGLSAADRSAIEAEVARFKALPGVDAAQVGSAEFASDGATASVSVPLVGQNGSVSVSGTTLASVEKSVLALARAGVPRGVVVHSAGPGGLLVALIDSFSGIDGSLLAAAGLVVILILLVVYRSPVLWFFPLFSAVLALGAASLVVYELAYHNLITLNGESQGILSVLVLGAGTDYALLIVSRYREELHNYDSRLEAMTKAWKRASPPIAASATTVILGLLCLEFGELNSDRSLGPVCAIGIACTLAVMLTFLPLALTVVPRGVFWPRVPRVDHEGDPVTHGAWSRFAKTVVAHDRPTWIVTAVVLAGLATAVVSLNPGMLSTSQTFTNKPDAVVGQQIYDAHFPQGAGAPVQIVADTAAVPSVISEVSRIPGVATAPGSVCVEADYARLAASFSGASGGGASGGGASAGGASAGGASAGGASAGGASASQAAPAGSGGCVPPRFQVSPVDGKLLVDATLKSVYTSPQATATMLRIRAAVAAIPGAHALVGGETAVNYDTAQAVRHDRNLIIPVVLVVILAVLMALLRSILGPVLLVATVILSYLATLGVSALVFSHLFGFAHADQSLPLFAFVFLVALGVDYNIFLVTRIREEAAVHGTRQGVTRGLAVTGGVITSAGVVLAATFAVLGVLPLVFLAELGFSVAFGVLLDTIVVRSVLVPGLAHDIGRRFWWPSKLAKGLE